jgi:hypothetical protein
VEAPIAMDRMADRTIAVSRGTKVVLTFGQSNATNFGRTAIRTPWTCNVFNMFDMEFSRDVDPLPGASNEGS